MNRVMQDSCVLEAANELTRVKSAMFSRKHKAAISSCTYIIDLATQFMDLSSHAEPQQTAEMVDVLMDCGHMCNTLMQHDIATRCFTFSVRLIVNVSNNNSLASRLCKAITNLVHTARYLNGPKAALEVLTKYSGFLRDMDLQEANNTIKACLGNLYLDVGIYLKKMLYYCDTMGRETLEKGRQYLEGLTDAHNARRYAFLLSLLGTTYIKTQHAKQCYDYLLQALNMWKNLQYPREYYKVILDTMRTVGEYEVKETLDNESVLHEFLQLHRKMQDLGLGMVKMDIADVMVDIGKIACEYFRSRRSTALTYFEEALMLYRNFSPSSIEKISNILKLVGTVHHRDEQYQNAVTSCLQSLAVLASQSGKENSTTFMEAECYAVLASSYSKLQDLDNALLFCNKALEVKAHLASHDLKWIEMHVGNLYFIKAVEFEKKTESTLAQQHYSAAEQAFQVALREHSQEILVHVDYGYYLLHQGKYESSIHILDQAYDMVPHGIITLMKCDVVVKEYSSMEDPILPEDLRTELLSQKVFAVPAIIMALFFKSMAQMKMGNTMDVQRTLYQFDSEMHETAESKVMCASCYSLLAYCYRDLAQEEKAIIYFQGAVHLHPDYAAAKANLKKLQGL